MAPLVDCDEFDGLHGSPLGAAAAKGHAAIVRMMLARANASLNLRANDKREVPLFPVVKYGREQVVRILLSAESL